MGSGLLFCVLVREAKGKSIAPCAVAAEYEVSCIKLTEAGRLATVRQTSSHCGLAQLEIRSLVQLSTTHQERAVPVDL
jgi:hypothetical protein